MANLEYISRYRKYSKNIRRFFTSLDMAIAKKDAAIRNSKAKRNEVTKFPNEYIARCGCGREGCFIHSGNETTRTQEQHNNFVKYWSKQS